MLALLGKGRALALLGVAPTEITMANRVGWKCNCVGRVPALFGIGRALALLGIAPTEVIMANRIGWMEM